MTAPKLFAALLAVGVMAAGPAKGQNAPPTRPAGDRPSSANPPRPPATEPLTAAELAKVKTVLAPHKPANLTAEEAKTIKRSLRDAGLRRSRELDAALVSAGFSPAKLDLLDPPPPRPAGEGAGPPPPLKK